MGMCLNALFNWVFLRVFIFLISSSSLSITNAQPYDYPIANLSTSWVNSPSSIKHSVNFTDGSMVRTILLRGSFGPRFACGFYCNGNCTSFFFSVYIVQTNSASGIVLPASGFPQVVWSANRYNPVSENATLQLTQEGDLILKDFDGSLVWSSNTSGKSVLGLSVTDLGNLVLFGRNNSTVWQSFDYPTDSLIPGQKLLRGYKLTADGIQGNLLSLSVTETGLFASIESIPPQFYYQRPVNSAKASYIRFQNGSFSMADEQDEVYAVIPISPAVSAQYMKLGSDGHLRVYEWDSSSGWKEVADLLKGNLGECGYPLVCGKYGLCSNGQCSCPGIGSNQTSYFRLLNERQPNLGCSEITPLSCKTPQDHRLLDLHDVTYFYYPANMTNIDIEGCKEACLKNCSCKAALFQYGWNESSGSCFLPTDLFSLMNNFKDMTHYNSSAFVKVQISPNSLRPSSNGSTIPAPEGTRKMRTGLVLGSILGAFFGLFLIVGILGFLCCRMRRTNDRDEEDYFDHVPGLPNRFLYEDLKTATHNFFSKLGEGGFGSVYEGTLNDGTKVAVKRLDGLGQIKKSFLAEVETIGSIHHVNLVRLVGFCANKSHRLLVYEYMCNGSLDKWIFDRSEEASLSWNTRRKIILDIAKGLAYLHEECRQKIVHLDIKPQNILLDNNFNAKVSDFGLSKLIDGDQSKIVTTMRGTPGYMAPEWLSSTITEKADVYSFGVVVMEIVCGRKNVDHSQPEEDMHLLGLLKRKAEEEQLFDMIDKHNEDMHLHKEEALEIIRIAAWCLQGDFTRRPSMSVVIKVLEGVAEVETNLDYTFSTTLAPAAVRARKEAKIGASTPLLPSVLSGPR